MKRSLVVFAVIFVLSIVCTVSGAIMVVSGGVNGDVIKNALTSNVKTVDISDKKSISADNVNIIELEDICCAIVLNDSESDNVEVSVEGKLMSFGSRVPELEVTERNGKIEITVKTENGFEINDISSFIDLHSIDSQDAVMTVSVPKSFNGEPLIKDVASRLECNMPQTNAESIKIKNTAGECYISVGGENNKIKNLTVSDCAGSVTVKGYIDDVKCEDTLGYIDLEPYNNFNNISVKDTLSHVNIKIPSDTKGTVYVKDCLANIHSDLPLDGSLSSSGAEINGGGNSRIEVKDSLGAVQIIALK